MMRIAPADIIRNMAVRNAGMREKAVAENRTTTTISDHIFMHMKGIAATATTQIMTDTIAAVGTAVIAVIATKLSGAA